MRKITLLIILLIINMAHAQEKLMTGKGIINFEASVPFFEEVKAKNEEAIFTLNPKANDLTCIVFIKKFRFKIGIMEAHFNSYYLESDRYQKSTFKGKIEKFDLKVINNPAKEYKITGQLEMHGKSKKITALARIKKVAKGIELISNFTVNTDDFKIEIPAIIKSKISKTVSIQIECVLQ